MEGVVKEEGKIERQCDVVKITLDLKLGDLSTNLESATTTWVSYLG